jgi:hypothetical protein
VRLVDAGALDRAAFDEMRERLSNALSKLRHREEDVAQLETRNAYLESELKRVEQIHTITLKEVITLRRGVGKPPKGRPSRCRPDLCSRSLGTRARRGADNPLNPLAFGISRSGVSPNS